MMSHEINNSMGAINSILNSCLNYTSRLLTEEKEDFSHAMEVAINRNSNLSNFMSNFASVIKIPAPVISELDLHSVLHSIKIVVEHYQNHKQINWNWELSSGPMLITGDREQLEQVFINVIKNAVEAIEQSGEIFISTSSSPTSLSVVDTGKGLSQLEQTKLFSPFFSTKKNGQGIGLTLVKEILINHGFHFSLDVNDDGKTEFKILF